MKIVNGLKHKMHPCDSPFRCRGCGHMYYIPHKVNGEWVKCPYCGKNS